MMAAKTRVVIIDSDAEELMNLVSYLGGAYELCQLNEGEDLIAQLVAQQPEILLLDDGLLDPTCYQLCQAIKADEGSQHLLVILISDLDADELDQEVEYIGADDYSCRPIAHNELLEKLTTLLAFHRAG